MGKRILVLGGKGMVGRRLGEAIAAMPSAECIVATRKPAHARGFAGVNTGAITVNVKDPASLRQALDGVFAVVNAGGPFQAHDYSVAETCAGLGIHYVDLAENRLYVQGITRLNRRAQQKNCQVVSGAGALPAVSAALVDMLVPEFDRISEIQISLSTGIMVPAGEVALRATLEYAGSAFRLKENGRWRYGYGWSESEKVEFPKPVGRRRVYLNDAPELDLFPTRYGAQTVISRAGLERAFFNRGLVLLARMRRWGWIKNLPDWAPALAATGRVFRGSGNVPGGIRVLVRGRRNEEDLEHTAFLLARDRNIAAISCSPALALIRRWLDRGVPDFGAVPCIGQLTWDDIKAEMLGHDIVLVRQ